MLYSIYYIVYSIYIYIYIYIFYISWIRRRPDLQGTDPPAPPGGVASSSMRPSTKPSVVARLQLSPPSLLPSMLTDAPRTRASGYLGTPWHTKAGVFTPREPVGPWGSFTVKWMSKSYMHTCRLLNLL